MSLLNKNENSKTKSKKKNLKKYNLVKQKRNKWIYAMSISSILYIGWRIIFTIPFKYGIISLIAGLLLVISELIAVVESLLNQNSFGKTTIPQLPEIPKEMYPKIDVFIATHSEECDLLYKTINGALYMDYPDKSKVNIYICDDGNRKSVKQLAKDMNVEYIGFPKAKHAKAGNLNNALSKTSSPLVVTFDADMIPKSSFLMKTVPYFFLPVMEKDKNNNWVLKKENEIDETEKIGFIQTPQTFYNPDLFQFNMYAEKNIPNEQDYFFKEVNVGRNASNAPIYAGSNTVISREALDEIGGIKVGTITEDFATGINIQKKGYRCYAVDEALASGMTPTTFSSLIKQRVRWGRGCVQTLLRPSFIFSKLSISSKLQYFASLLYWSAFFRRIIYIFSPILFAVFGIIVVDMVLWQFLLIGLPCYLIYNKSLNVLSDKKIDFRWSNIVDTILAPFLVIPIFLETFGIRLKKFKVTEKTSEVKKNSNWTYAIPNIIFLIASIIGIIFILNSIISLKSYANLIILWWLILNSYFLVMAIVFTTGRINYRSSERFEVQMPIEIVYKQKKYTGEISDISETGLSFSLNDSIFFDYNDILKMTIEDRQYKSIFKSQVIHVSQKEDYVFKYHVQNVEIDDENKKQYFGLLYDREPCFSKKIKTRGLSDLFKFFKEKSTKKTTSKRKLHRVDINKNYILKNGIEFTLYDLNGEYISTNLSEKTKKIKFNIYKEIEISAKYVNKMSEEKTLYKIDDWVNIAEKINDSDFLKNNQ